ncbi:MAG: TIGR03086 family metal-binding protein [Nocardioides sp.]|uniref:TIGR03086 family metal-binding protein n=1 Tax=Nocardioides sp. TaxID=35761 RepID=UPI003EFF1AC9
MTSTTTTDYTRLADRFGSVLPGAEPGAVTPCTGWTVRDVVAHVLDTQRDFLLGHDVALPQRPALDDLAGAWGEHSAAVAAVLDQPGVAERAYDGYFGPTTIGGTMADFYGFDLVVHGWDVARASDQPWPLDDEEAAAWRRTAESWGPAIRAEGICGPEVAVPDEASGWDRLLGFVGRDPGWAPAGS